jgi:hypothetical protein
VVAADVELGRKDHIMGSRSAWTLGLAGMTLHVPGMGHDGLAVGGKVGYAGIGWRGDAPLICKQTLTSSVGLLHDDPLGPPPHKTKGTSYCHVGDVFGLLLDFDHRTLSLYVNGARHGLLVFPQQPYFLDDPDELLEPDDELLSAPSRGG